MIGYLDAYLPKVPFWLDYYGSDFLKHNIFLQYKSYYMLKKSIINTVNLDFFDTKVHSIILSNTLSKYSYTRFDSIVKKLNLMNPKFRDFFDTKVHSILTNTLTLGKYASEYPIIANNTNLVPYFYKFFCALSFPNILAYIFLWPLFM